MNKEWWEDKIHNGVKWIKKPEETILDKDWEVLCIFDACRHDIYQEVRGKPVDYIDSVGTCTGQWFRNTFNGKTCKDIVYVTANVYTSLTGLTRIKGRQKIGYNPFFKIIDAFEELDQEGKLIDMSAGQFKMPEPSDMTEKVIKAVEDYPDKRILAHYIPPHAPFRDLQVQEWEARRKIKHLLKLKAFEEMKTKEDLTFNHEHPGKYEIRTNIYDVIKKDPLIIEVGELREEYKKNMEWICKEIPTLEKINKKVVISSDHGECLGEYGLSGHPVGIRVKELVRVPWDVL